MVLNEHNPVRQRVRASAMIDESEGLSNLYFQAMGTQCRVSLVEPSRATANSYLDHLLNWVADFEATYSRFLDTSLVSRINAAAGHDWISIDPETEKIFDLCDQLHFLTRGVVDPTSLPLIRLWNWKSSPPVVPSPNAVEAARGLVGWNKVQRRPGSIFLPQPGMGIDLGGVGKEYAVDIAVEMGRHFGVENLLVDFGQDIRVCGRPQGKPGWHVGLQDPAAPDRCWGSVAVTNHAVASSGDYLRHFVVAGRRYGHILDVRTGWPVHNGCRYTVAIAPTCTMAGILTTTAFVLGAEEGRRFIETQLGAAGALLDDRNTRHFTRNFYEYLVHQT